MEPQCVGSIEILISYVYLYLMEYPHPREPSEVSPFAEALIFADEATDYVSAYKAFTCSPDPKRYKSNDPGDQWRSLLMCILLQKRLSRCFKKFIFVPELNENGNIHFHGYYSIDNQYEYNRWFLPACKKWGWCKIKERVDDYWLYEYVPKDIEKMEQVLPELPIVLTNDNIELYRHMRDKYIAIKPKYTMSKIPKVIPLSKYIPIAKASLEQRKKYIAENHRVESYDEDVDMDLILKI